MNDMTEENKLWVDAVWEKADRKMRAVSEASRDKIPYTTIHGIHNNMAQDDVTWWTNGFWAGLMWLLYIGTGSGQYKEVARRAEELLDGAFKQYDKLHHDVGFMWLLSSGVDYRLSGDGQARLRTLYAADLLASRYNAEGRYLRSWNEDKVGWVIIDSLMNIPLLYWAAEEHQDPRYRYIAERHADTVLRTHLRGDGSVNHIVRLDPMTGEVLETFGGQGYENGSSWSRGQSWALYGFTLSYIHAGKREYLDAAKRVAHYVIACLAQTDYVPAVDYRAPEEPHKIDATAGAIAACGLIELAGQVGEYEKRLYLDSAVKILKALERRCCDWTEEEQSILQMGTEAYHSEESRTHIPIIYGDYFFVEAVYKLKGFEPMFW